MANESPPSSKPGTWASKSGTWAIISIITAVALAFGPHAPSLGFYQDDWTFLDLAARGGGFLGGVREFASAGYLTRPGHMVQFPLFFAIGGLDPLPYHLLLLAMKAAEAVLFFLLLQRLLGSGRLALAAAILSAIHPSRSALAVWPGSSIQTAAQLLVLASLVVFQRGIEERRPRDLALSQGLYLAGCLCYEAAAFLPLLLAGCLAGRAWAKGVRPRDAVARPLASLWPYGASLAAVVLYQRLASSFLPGPNPKSVSLSLAHLLKAFGAGFECLTNRVLHLAWTTLPGFWSESSAAVLLAWLGLSAAAAFILGGDEDWRGPAMRAAAGGALFGFIGAYLPYALSGSYAPQVFGFMSRTNGGGALIGGLLPAMAAGTLARRPWLQRAFLFLTVLAFTAADWQTGRLFARHWADQQKLLAGVSLAAAPLPPGSVVLLGQAPREGPALVAGHYDFSAALRLKTGRKDLSGELLGSPFAPEGPDVYIFSEKAGAIATRH